MATTPIYFVKIALDGTVTEYAASDTIPIGATAITKEQHDTIAGCVPQQCRLINGVVLPIPPLTPTYASLADLQLAATQRIDQQAEVARLQFLTPGSGQTLEYQETESDAARLIASTETNPQAANYPWLAAEQSALASVGVTAALRDIATAVTAQMGAWATTGAEIKRLRRQAKLLIAAATTMQAVHDAADHIVWPRPPGP